VGAEAGSTDDFSDRFEVPVEELEVKQRQEERKKRLIGG
jgi:hypothetical protein